ncbi:MAG: CARDB domain-containing protein, partial [Candidatus Aenigmatarchaeota archaeon]
IISSYSPTSLTPSLNEGSSLAFSVTASDPDSDPLTYSWKLDGTQVSTSSSYTYSPGYADSGSHAVTATVSDGSLTATNAWTVSVTNVALPDLTITESQTPPSNPHAGNWFQVIFVMKNAGETATGQANWKMYSGTSDADVEDAGPISLAAGGETTVYGLMKYAAAGTYHPKIVLDYLGSVAELSEINNEQTLTVQVS